LVWVSDVVAGMLAADGFVCTLPDELGIVVAVAI
jgi:hypothetical protein